MKTFFFSILALAAGIVPASAITVSAPQNGAALTSPFTLTANTEVCDSKKAVSMGYSIDHGPTIITSTSFTATVEASAGKHILHVKCWGKKAHEDEILLITVGSGTPAPPSTADAPTFSPVAGQYTTAETVILTSQTPGATIYYTADGTAPGLTSPQYSVPIVVSASTVIEAIAVAPGLSNSGLARADYTIGQQQTNPLVPSDAIAINEIQAIPDWKFNHDPGTQGSSYGEMTLVNNPSLNGEAAQFNSHFENWGGEIYSKSYGIDADAMNFLYDGYVWIEAGSNIGNLEMDNNQVIANGDTVIYAFQCAGDHNTWDYSSNAGTPDHPNVKWLRSSQPCNPADWAPNVWHHVQISYSRDDVGNVSYHSVWLDGVEAPINETVNSAFRLGWSHGDLMTNFQVDGAGTSGSSTLYLDNLTIYRW